jgi:hypothetical protein
MSLFLTRKHISSGLRLLGMVPAYVNFMDTNNTTDVNGRLEISSREGLKAMNYREHPRKDGSLQIITLEDPVNARELRAVAEELETREKTLARERAGENQ